MSQKRSQPLDPVLSHYLSKRYQKAAARSLAQSYLEQYLKTGKLVFLWSVLVCCLGDGIAIPAAAKPHLLRLALRHQRKLGHPGIRLGREVGLAMAVYRHWSRSTPIGGVQPKWTGIYEDVAELKKTSVASVRRAWKEHKQNVGPSHVLKNEMRN